MSEEVFSWDDPNVVMDGAPPPSSALPQGMISTNTYPGFAPGQQPIHVRPASGAMPQGGDGDLLSVMLGGLGGGGGGEDAVPLAPPPSAPSAAAGGGGGDDAAAFIDALESADHAMRPFTSNGMELLHEPHATSQQQAAAAEPPWPPPPPPVADFTGPLAERQLGGPHPVLTCSPANYSSPGMSDLRVRPLMRRPPAAPHVTAGSTPNTKVSTPSMYYTQDGDDGMHLLGPPFIPYTPSDLQISPPIPYGLGPPAAAHPWHGNESEMLPSRPRTVPNLGTANATSHGGSRPLSGTGMKASRPLSAATNEISFYENGIQRSRPSSGLVVPPSANSQPSRAIPRQQRAASAAASTKRRGSKLVSGAAAPLNPRAPGLVAPPPRAREVIGSNIQQIPGAGGAPPPLGGVRSRENLQAVPLLAAAATAAVGSYAVSADVRAFLAARWEETGLAKPRHPAEKAAAASHAASAEMAANVRVPWSKEIISKGKEQTTNTDRLSKLMSRSKEKRAKAEGAVSYHGPPQNRKGVSHQVRIAESVPAHRMPFNAGVEPSGGGIGTRPRAAQAMINQTIAPKDGGKWHGNESPRSPPHSPRMASAGLDHSHSRVPSSPRIGTA